MPFHFPLADTSSTPERVWVTALNELSQRIRPAFVRSESYRQALLYIQGLMSDASRKNGWQVAEAMGEATPYAMQHVLDRAKWDCDEVRDALRGYVWENLTAPNAVVVIDETGFLKKGCKSAGVQRQYSGTAGRIENCQVGVFLSYASSRGHTLLDRELYLPKSWADDQERCREAHVPPSVMFATKPELARRMLERTLDSGLPVLMGCRRYGLWESSSLAGIFRRETAGVCSGSSLQGTGRGAGNPQASRSASSWHSKGRLAGVERRRGEQGTPPL